MENSFFTQPDKHAWLFHKPCYLCNVKTSEHYSIACSFTVDISKLVAGKTEEVEVCIGAPFCVELASATDNVVPEAIKSRFVKGGTETAFGQLLDLGDGWGARYKIVSPDIAWHTIKVRVKIKEGTEAEHRALELFGTGVVGCDRLREAFKQ